MIDAVELMRRPLASPVSARIAPGEIVSVAGPATAGSILLRLLATLLRPDSGRLTIAGVDALADPLEARRHLAYVSPDVPLPEGLTVREYLEFLARARGRDASAAAVALDRFELPRHGLLRRLRAPIQQRVRVAAAAACGASVLLLDSPTRHLDERGRASLLEWMLAERTMGRVIVVSDAWTPADAAARTIRLTEVAA